MVHCHRRRSSSTLSHLKREREREREGERERDRERETERERERLKYYLNAVKKIMFCFVSFLWYSYVIVGYMDRLFVSVYQND